MSLRRLYSALTKGTSPLPDRPATGHPVDVFGREWSEVDAAVLSSFLSGDTGLRLRRRLINDLAVEALNVSSSRTTENALHAAGRIAGAMWLHATLEGLAFPAPAKLVPVPAQTEGRPASAESTPDDPVDAERARRAP